MGSSGRVPAQYALHSGKIGEATQLASQGVPEPQIQHEGSSSSSSSSSYIRTRVHCQYSSTSGPL